MLQEVPTGVGQAEHKYLNLIIIVLLYSPPNSQHVSYKPFHFAVSHKTPSHQFITLLVWCKFAGWWPLYWGNTKTLSNISNHIPSAAQHHHPPTHTRFQKEMLHAITLDKMLKKKRGQKQLFIGLTPEYGFLLTDVKWLGIFGWSTWISLKVLVLTIKALHSLGPSPGTHSKMLNTQLIRDKYTFRNV